MSTGVILVGAGSGERFGQPKALVELAGKTLLAHAADAFDAIPHRVAVVRAEDVDAVSLPGWTVVAGGRRRRDSVACGLAALPSSTKRVLVHDVARPFVSKALVARLMACSAPCVIPVIPIPDTVKEVDGDRVVRTLPRARLAAVQTPQLFDFGLLERALRATAADATDEAGLVEALGEPVQTVPGAPQNLKITTPTDLIVAGALLSG